MSTATNDHAGPGTALVVEDLPGQRSLLHNGLVARGYRVRSAGTVADARRWIAELGDELDVAVLDMRLDDPEARDVTGADLGKEIRQRPGVRWPAQLLIYSAHDDAEFYRCALDLRVAAYLRKVKQPPEEVFQHVRALTLRRRWGMERPDLALLVAEAAERGRSPFEAVQRLAEGLFLPELQHVLGEGAFLFLSWTGEGEDGASPAEQTVAFDPSGALPRGPLPILQRIQDLVFGQAGEDTPLRLEAQGMRQIGLTASSLLTSLDGATMVPLGRGAQYRLSIGFLRGAAVTKLRDKPDLLARLISRYVRLQVIDNMVKVVDQWTRSNIKLQAMIQATARFCTTVGEEQLALLTDACDAEEVTFARPHVRALHRRAEQLRDVGQSLDGLLEHREHPPAQSLSMAQIVERAWGEVRQILTLDKACLHLDGDCRIQGHGEWLELATSGVLYWLARRSARACILDRAPITVHCRPPRPGCTAEQDGLVVFEDRSRRMRDGLRRKLFLPFAHGPLFRPDQNEPRGPLLPLYLAKSLVEVGNRGRLVDESSDLSSADGHRLVMRLPPAVSTGEAEVWQSM